MGADACVVYYGVRYQITDESELTQLSKRQHPLMQDTRERLKRAGFSLVPALQIQFEPDY